MLWYKEIKDVKLVAAWFAFATVTLAGVVLLMLYG